jgi:hypothetical protein
MMIRAAPADTPPFPVEAVVAEEDTYLVLSAEPVLREPQEHPLRILQAVHEAEPIAPGSIVVQAATPLRLLAVIHDLAAEPSWREEWIAAAYTGVFEEVAGRGICALGLPLLGTVHGRLPQQRASELLVVALAQSAPSCLEYLWLMDADATTLQGLQE